MRKFESALGAKMNGVPDTDSGSDPTTKKYEQISFVIAFTRLWCFWFLEKKKKISCSSVKTKKVDFLQVIFYKKLLIKIHFRKKGERQGQDQSVLHIW